MSVIKYKDSNGNYVKIPANVGINNVVEGYYNETDSKFYEESTYETEITAETNKIYISLDTDKSYYWDGSEYKLLSGSGGVTDFDDLTNRPLESAAIDIDDLDLPMPAKPTEYPVLFDETGTEYQVGLYKRASDGKVKPVYRKCFYNLVLSTNNAYNYFTHSISNIENFVKYDGLIHYTNTETYSVGYRNSDFSSYLEINSTNIKIFNRGWTNKPVSVNMYYTKTTDTWKEV